MKPGHSSIPISARGHRAGPAEVLRAGHPGHGHALGVLEQGADGGLSGNAILECGETGDLCSPLTKMIERAGIMTSGF